LKTRIKSARLLLAEVQQILDRKPNSRPQATVEEVVELLHEQRRYLWIGIYLVSGNEAVCQAFRGPEPVRCSVTLGEGSVGGAAQSGTIKLVPDVAKSFAHAARLPQTKSEMAVPIKIANRVLGVLAAQSERLDGFSYPEQVLLRRLGRVLSRFLVSSSGKLLQRKLRAKLAAAVKPAAEPKLNPAPDHTAALPMPKRRAAAGVATVS